MQRLVLSLVFLGLWTPAYAQIGGLSGILNKAQKVEKKLDDLNVTDEEEAKIGRDVSARIRERFGVVQDPAVTKYVTLVGTLLARSSERPGLAWTFIVLDTDGVNAFASPGGIVHITRGALGLIHNESELAGVLGHEITHVAHKHTVNAIRKSRAVQLGAKETMSDRGPLLDKVANQAYKIVLENAFDRGDELDADKGGIALAAKLGYAPSSLADFLARLDERNRDVPERNGLFASHPDTQERIAKVRAMAGSRSGATVEARYKANVSYRTTPVTQIATIVDGASGLTGSTRPAADGKDKQGEDTKKKKKGFGLGSLGASVAPESQSAQVSASGGARGVGPDRAARGGPNPNIVAVNVTESELREFQKGIAG